MFKVSSFSGRFALQRISALSQANCNGLPHKKGAWRLVSSGSSGPSDSVEHDIMSSIAKKVTAGQPTPITHPHLLQPDEVSHKPMPCLLIFNYFLLIVF